MGEPDHLAPWVLLGPRADVCRECAADHLPEEPHDAQSLYYKYRFYQTKGRWPTWMDALAHVGEPFRAAWIEELTRVGVNVDSEYTGRPPDGEHRSTATSPEGHESVDG